MSELSRTLTDLKDAYLALHTRKEDQFWIAKMGLADDNEQAQRALGEAEIALNEFLQDTGRLQQLRQLEASGEGSEADRAVLQGWIALFAAHGVEDPAARALSASTVAAEQELQVARGGLQLGYVDPASGKLVPASSVKLGTMIRTERDEGRRKAAWEGLRSIEGFVLERGFLEIVKMRNRFARMQGYEDYYDYRVQTVERMSKRELFAVLEDLADRTEAHTKAELAKFEKEHGAGSLEPWNFVFLRSGSITREIDPYFGFADALERWGRSFAALGVKYRDATLTLDLVDRKGKYENGFMHGPGPAFFDEGRWRPARINFTANALPGQVGSGVRAMQTLFHEGGHAAHFSNILAPAPCFSQEFAPTSVAYAETQSMFMDSLLGDADWRTRYARDAEGRPMPWELIERSIREEQPLRAWDVRSMLTVPFAERAIYEIPDDELTPERVLEEIRAVERRLTGLTSAARPTLAVPHLLAGESSAYYHGYVLAEMAVYQTRRFFLQRDGHLVDNARIGPDLAAAYWAPGNAVSFNATLEALTGRKLEADALVEECLRSVDGALELARTQVERLAQVPVFDGPVELEAKVRVVHGRQIVADTEEGGFAAAAARFAAWVDEQARAAS
ncbi:M3 family metallopeptidase [Vulgatibacter sp.]|uniref:M3 family metallopeptidase n=1 Tax=Vulgatibacter sp. TaxID=1971226 RepID=UPI003567D076